VLLHKAFEKTTFLCGLVIRLHAEKASEEKASEEMQMLVCPNDLFE